MKVDEMLKSTRSWIAPRRGGGIVVSSRIRLARNISGLPFPSWGGSDASKKLYKKLAHLFVGLDSLQDAVVLPLEDISQVDREVLCERRLISGELVEKGAGSGIVVDEKQRVAVMINEEDHLRLQVLRPGLDLLNAWKLLNQIDSELEHHIRYAFSPTLGYLTSCPSNVGTGMRVSVMLHLPGLKLMNEIDRVVTGMNRMGFAVRGTFGEGSDEFGNMYQISNQATLGISEFETVRRVQDIAETLVEIEMNTRKLLLQKRELSVRDFVSRAVGVYKYAVMLSTGETLDLLSALRLGLDFDMLSGVSLSRINEMMLMVQPGHIQKKVGRELSVKERDMMRSKLMRHGLKGLRITKWNSD